MKKKKPIFWMGLLLVVLAVFSFIDFGILSTYALDLLPLAAIGTGIYLLIKH